jgi:DNA-binding LacI/PurR family transcriptional regulator
LAREYRVSTMTVRQAIRVLEDEGKVYRIAGTGAFVRPSLPRAVAPGRTTIAFVAVDLGSAFDMGIARGIESACQECGWGIQIFDAKGDPEVEARNLACLRESGSRGAIILPLCNHDDLEAM